MTKWVGLIGIVFQVLVYAPSAHPLQRVTFFKRKKHVLFASLLPLLIYDKANSFDIILCISSSNFLSEYRQFFGLK